MKRISSKSIVEGIAELVVRINRRLPESVRLLLQRAHARETEPHSKKYLETVLWNIRLADKENLPLCQDTGLITVFVEMGQEAGLVLGSRGSLEDAINEGIRLGTERGSLRPSVVTLFDRVNTGTNTPAVVHYFPAPGDGLRITLLAKGFGSENVSAIRMLKPGDGKEGVERFLLETIRQAGPNPCPPVFVGLGVGGTFEKAALLSKLALCELDVPSDRPWRAWEKELLQRVNETGIGPAGFGGKTTALAVGVKTFPTHIAGLPVAISIACWAHRVGSIVL